MIRILKLNAFLLLVIALANNQCYSQKINYVGLNFTLEKSPYNFQPGIGVVFERQFTHRSGVETGVYYHNYKQELTVTQTDSTGVRIFPLTVSERYFSVPILYRFYSRVVNLSAGPTFDFFTSWKQTNKTSLASVSAYNKGNTLEYGILLKASKKINLTEDFFLEPEFRFNPTFRSWRRHIGLGIVGKYKL